MIEEMCMSLHKDLAEIQTLLKNVEEVPEWCIIKLATAAAYASSIKDYLNYEIEEELEDDSTTAASEKSLIEEIEIIDIIEEPAIKKIDNIIDYELLPPSARLVTT